jgi:hypothetical protein
VEALDTYSAQRSNTHAQATKRLKNEIQSFAQTIPSDKSTATSKIDGWWNQLADWSGGFAGSSS